MIHKKQLTFLKIIEMFLKKGTTSEIYTSTTILLPNCDDTPNQSMFQNRNMHRSISCWDSVSEIN
jgi:hypothetical protein